MADAYGNNAPLTRRERRNIADALSRHGRKKTGLLLAEGLRCCTEALRHCPRAIHFALVSKEVADSANASVFMAEARRVGTPVRLVPGAEFAEFTDTRTPQGILCVLRRDDLPTPPDLTAGPATPFVLILDRISDPGNLGTILRTARAVGLREVWLTDGTTDPYAPKAVRAGMGAQFTLVPRMIPDLDAARALLRSRTSDDIENLWIAVPGNGVSCFSTDFEINGIGLVIGNEASGVRAGTAGRRVSIPMPGDAESLNAAQAATVLLFEAVRRGVLEHSKTKGKAML